MNQLHCIAGIAVIWIINACQSPINVDKEKEAIKEVLQNSSQSWLDRDFETMSSLWVHDVHSSRIAAGRGSQGVVGFHSCVARNLNYPAKARRAGAEGGVTQEFLINENGEISEVILLRGIGYGCNEVAKRVIASSPNWISGEQRSFLDFSVCSNVFIDMANLPPTAGFILNHHHRPGI